MILFFRTPSKSVIAVESNHQLTPDESNKLCWLFGEAVMESEENLKGCFVGPRREMITPWSTNAVEITQTWGSKASAASRSTSLLRTKTLTTTRCSNACTKDSTQTYSRQTVSRNRSSTSKISKCIMKKKVWLFLKRKWTT